MRTLRSVAVRPRAMTCPSGIAVAQVAALRSEIFAPAPQLPPKMTTLPQRYYTGRTVGSATGGARARLLRQRDRDARTGAPAVPMLAALRDLGGQDQARRDLDGLPGDHQRVVRDQKEHHLDDIADLSASIEYLTGPMPSEAVLTELCRG
jgi:hypothetical protein